MAGSCNPAVLQTLDSIRLRHACSPQGVLRPRTKPSVEDPADAQTNRTDTRCWILQPGQAKVYGVAEARTERTLRNAMNSKGPVPWSLNTFSNGAAFRRIGED